MIVRYVQEALKFKLHFNSRLNAEEATCEKCLHMCGTVVTVLLLLLLLLPSKLLLLLLLLPLLLLLNGTSVAEAVAVWEKLHCHSHELSVELALSTVHTKCTDTLFPFVFGMSLGFFFWRLVDCLFSAGE